jgi:hypothetical protein
MRRGAPLGEARRSAASKRGASAVCTTLGGVVPSHDPSRAPGGFDAANAQSSAAPSASVAIAMGILERKGSPPTPSSGRRSESLPG